LDFFLFFFSLFSLFFFSRGPFPFFILEIPTVPSGQAIPSFFRKVSCPGTNPPLFFSRYFPFFPTPKCRVKGGLFFPFQQGIFSGQIRGLFFPFPTWSTRGWHLPLLVAGILAFSFNPFFLLSHWPWFPLEERASSP